MVLIPNDRSQTMSEAMLLCYQLAPSSKMRGTCKVHCLAAHVLCNIQDKRRLDVPPLLLLVVACVLLLFFLLIVCSAYLFWSWRDYKEEASQRAECICELQDVQKLHA